MKKQYFINANIVDPHNSINEVGGLIIGEDGKIEAVGKKVNTNNLPTREKPVDLKGKHLFPGLVDMRVFVGEPGFEYKENFRTLSDAALSGGVTSVVTMPNTNPIIDNVSIVDFLKRRGRDKSKINIFPCASLTKNIEGANMTEFGLLQKKGIIAFTDGIRTIQNPRLMSRIMNSAKDLGCLIMQHAEDYELAKNGMINSGIIATKLGLSGNFTSQVNAIMNKHQRNVGDVEALDLANTYFGAFNDGKPIIVVDVIDLKKDGIQVDKTNKKIVLIKDGAYKIIGDYSGG